MNLRPYALAAFAAFVPALLTGCPASESMTTAEATQALEEVSVEAQASQVANGTIEISTNFTIGQAVADAAAELKTFVETQLPCAEITLVDSTLTVKYGAKPGNCTYKGQTYSGTHTITVTKDDMGDVIVDHSWQDMKNQTVSVTGTATVTWSFDDPSRHVVSDLVWTRLSDGRTGEGKRDEVQKPLSGGLLEGISVDGTRSWEGQKGEWDLDINNIEIRWVDPVPQSGSYELTSPEGKKATLSFTRVDAASIQAKFETGKKEYTFIVKQSGAIEDKSGSGG